MFTVEIDQCDNKFAAEIINEGKQRNIETQPFNMSDKDIRRQQLMLLTRVIADTLQKRAFPADTLEFKQESDGRSVILGYPGEYQTV